MGVLNRERHPRAIRKMTLDEAMAEGEPYIDHHAPKRERQEVLRIEPGPWRDPGLDEPLRSSTTMLQYTHMYGYMYVCMYSTSFRMILMHAYVPVLASNLKRAAMSIPTQPFTFGKSVILDRCRNPPVPYGHES